MNQCPNCLGKGCTRCLKPAESVKLPASMVDVIGQIASDRNPPHGHVRLDTGEDRKPLATLWCCQFEGESFATSHYFQSEEAAKLMLGASDGRVFSFFAVYAAEAARGKKEGRYE